MKKGCSSAQCCDNAYSARSGALLGTAIGSLHIVYHALTNQVPEDIYQHVLGELIAGALGGSALFAAVSAACNWFKQSA
jgi:hypothetical protein